MSSQYLEHISFLVVEDNLFARELVREILKVLGARRIDFARNGQEGYSKFKESPADVVLLDWQMNPVDGIQFTRQVRKASDSPNPYVPIIMMTGFADRVHVFKARDTGVTEYLIKPFSARALFNRIQAVIERPRRFVRIGQYFGPDHRRQEKEHLGADRRGAADKAAAAAAPAPSKEMGQDEINALFNPDEEVAPKDAGKTSVKKR